MTTRERGRRTQTDRRAISRSALLEAAARGLGRHGYAALSLAQVAAEAGYTRGALYHQFAGKEELALAVVHWVQQTWQEEVGYVLSDETDPAETLLALARNHAVFCRRDVASVLLTLRVEFDQRDHPIGHAITAVVDDLLGDCVRLIEAGRAGHFIPPGPPARDTAEALIGALEAVGIQVAGRAPHDVVLAERAVRGILALAQNEHTRSTT